jgi:hypothetical protein
MMSNGDEPLIGRSVAKEQKQRHYEGWDKALDDAINKFEGRYPDAEGEFTADLKLSITFYRKSPGWVGEYKIELQGINPTP